jgi:sugar lactone lactonase YvrE
LREGNSIWKLKLDAGTWEHIAGTEKSGYAGDGGEAKTAEFRGPKGIALSQDRLLYIVDTENHMIRHVDLKTGLIHCTAGSKEGKPTDIHRIGDGGVATSARLARPHGVCVDRTGTVYIGDSETNRVRRVKFE